MNELYCSLVFYLNFIIISLTGAIIFRYYTKNFRNGKKILQQTILLHQLKIENKPIMKNNLSDKSLNLRLNNLKLIPFFKIVLICMI